MKILSADPGKSGAIVICEWESSLLLKFTKYKMPMLSNGKDYDIRQIRDIFYEQDYDMISIEDVHSIHGASANSNFQFGLGVGILRAMAEASDKPYHLIAPKDWQAIAWKGIVKTKDPKANSLCAVHRMFPKRDLTHSERATIPHNGIVDALLLNYATYMKFK